MFYGAATQATLSLAMCVGGDGFHGEGWSDTPRSFWSEHTASANLAVKRQSIVVAEFAINTVYSSGG